MKRNSTINRIKNMTSMDIEGLKRSELETLLRKGSRSFYQNVYNLKKNIYGRGSAYLAQVEGKLPKVYTGKQISKMTLPELKRAFKDLTRGSKIQSSTITGAKQVIKQISEKTGASVSELLELTSDEWKTARELMEEHDFSSEQIIRYSYQYKQTLETFDIDILREYITKEDEAKKKEDIDKIDEKQAEKEVHEYDASEFKLG